MKTAEEKARELYPQPETPTQGMYWNVSIIDREQKAFLKGCEYAKQQPEVDYQKMFANCSLPNERQPEQGEVEGFIEYLADRHPTMKYHGDAMNIHQIKEAYDNWSTLTQDNVREAAEKLLERLDGMVRPRYINVELAEPIYKLRQALNN